MNRLISVHVYQSMSANTLRFVNRGSNVLTTGALAVLLHVAYHLPVESTVVLRVDGRSGSWRVDVAKPMQSWWEAIDGGDGFSSASEAKAFARRWLEAARAQGTMAPQNVARPEGPGLAKCARAERVEVAA